MANQLKLSILFLIVIFIVGTAGFMTIEQLPLTDALYLTMMTVATVGFGDVVPQTTAGRMFTIALIIFGVGTAYYTFTLIFGLIVEGKMKDIFGRQDMKKEIEKIDDHIIVCGMGKVGYNIVRSLLAEQEKFLVIENNETKYQQLLHEKIPAIYGDATLDEILLNAGLLRAKGIITSLPHDADNVYVTLTARSLNPNIIIVAQAERAEAEEKMRRAGANTVVSPAVSSGRQMVTAMTKPAILDFLENVFYNPELNLDIAQITISSQSPLTRKTVASSGIKQKFNSIVVAIKKADKLISNPRTTQVLEVDDILIVLGLREDLARLTKAASADPFS